MKKKIAALVLGALLSVSAAAMAATPDAEMMSTQQEKAAAWVDTMLVKNDPAAFVKKAVGEPDISGLMMQVFTSVRMSKSGSKGGMRSTVIPQKPQTQNKRLFNCNSIFIEKIKLHLYTVLLQKVLLNSPELLLLWGFLHT